MSKNARKLRFAAKVKIEREVLSLINSSKLASEYKLAGMTKDAVLTWKKMFADSADPSSLSKVVEKTLGISRNAHIISDNSRTVFAEGVYFNNEKYDQDISDLKIMLDKYNID